MIVFELGSSVIGSNRSANCTTTTAEWWKNIKSFLSWQSTINQNRFDQINTTSDWWNWAEATIISQLRVSSMYNGQPPYGLRGYIGNSYLRLQIFCERISNVYNGGGHSGQLGH